MLATLLKRFTQRSTSKWSVEQVEDLIFSENLDAAYAAASYLIDVTPQRPLIQLALQAHINFLRHQSEIAEQVFRSILIESPSLAYAHYGLSLVLAEQGQHALALEHAQFALNLKEGDAKFLSQLGYCYMLVDSYSKAEHLIRQALKFRPENKYDWNNLAIIARLKGDPAEAKVCWLHALEIDPNFSKAQENMQLLDEELEREHMIVSVSRHDPGVLVTNHTADGSSGPIPWKSIEQWIAAGHIDKALNEAEADWPEQPSQMDTLMLVQLYRVANDLQSAVELLQRWLMDHPEDSVVWQALGVEWLLANQPKAAIDPLEQAIACGAQSAVVHANLAHALFACERYGESLKAIEAACQQDPSPIFLKRQAGALMMCCRYEEAFLAYRHLLDNQLVEISEIKGNYLACLSYLGRFDEALPLLDETLSHQAHDASLRLMRAIIHLLHERWELGWSDYRWRGTSLSAHFRTLSFPKWTGQPLTERTIVLLAEQGLGDQIMFASCIPDLLRLQPARVIIEASHRVSQVLARSFPNCEFIPTSQEKDLSWASNLGHVDYFVPLGDLPGRFRNRSSDFPGLPYLKASSARSRHWRSWLEKQGPGPYRGFSWKGGTELTRTAIRTIDTLAFAPIIRDHAGTWVCLQYGEVATELAKFRDLGLQVAYTEESIADLDEFAALISQLDQVLTVCNTTVHFAGALGIPTLVLAPRVPEWRYGLHFDTMPWYHSAKILRQDHQQEWGPALSRVNHLLDDTDNSPTHK